jgi:NAD(P)-dependent dehydrogenase (short-subunit alcohol dehydrogenase family)
MMTTPETADAGCVVVVGGTSGIGLEVVKHYARQGREVVLTGRDADRAAAIADEIGGRARGVALDLTMPDAIAGALASAPAVEHLVLAAIDRDHNVTADYDLKRAAYLVTLKLVGYTEVVHALLPRISPAGSIVVFGGQAKERPYPGSTTVSTVNGGIVGMVHTLAAELAPIRVNGIHPGIVGDSPYWLARPPAALEAARSRTPIGRLVTMAEVTNAVTFLLENGGVNGANLAVDGGWLLK